MSRRKLVLALLALAASTAILYRIAIPAACTQTHGFAAYYTASRILLNRPADMSRVYDDDWFRDQIQREGIDGVRDIFNVQPPTMSLLATPVAGFSPDTARTVWIWLSVVLLAAGLAILARNLDWPPICALYTLPFCLVYTPVRECLHFGQAYIVMFFLLCLVFRCSGVQVLRGSGGVALGLMVILKGAGLWLWIPLLFTRRWWTVLIGGVTVIGIAVLSLPFVGLSAWLAYFELLPQFLADPSRNVTAYQTVSSLFGRLFAGDPVWNPSPALHAPALAHILTAAVLIGSLAITIRSLRAAEEQGNHLLGIAMTASLIVATAPVAEGYHYTMLLPSLVVGFSRFVRERQSTGSAVWLAAATVLLTVPVPYNVASLSSGWAVIFAYPRVYGSYLLWGFLASECFRREQPASEQHSSCAADPAALGSRSG